MISIVIPAYNEELRLSSSLETIVSYFAQKNYDYELLVVDDGSSDSTSAVVRAFASKNAAIRLVSYPLNKGKGYAVRTGVSHARGDYILFSDADLSTPISEFDHLFSDLKSQDVDIVIGSRALKHSKITRSQPLHRVLLGKTFNVLVRIVAIKGIKDTQCGFKLFSAKAAKACFSRQKLHGFSFDVEILFLAQKLGFTIAEVPVIWKNDAASKVNPLRDSWRMLRDLCTMRFLHLKL